MGIHLLHEEINVYSISKDYTFTDNYLPSSILIEYKYNCILDCEYNLCTPCSYIKDMHKPTCKFLPISWNKFKWIHCGFFTWVLIDKLYVSNVIITVWIRLCNLSLGFPRKNWSTRPRRCCWAPGKRNILLRINVCIIKECIFECDILRAMGQQKDTNY